MSIMLVCPKLKMDQVRYRDMEHDKTILGIHYLTDRAVNKFEEFVKIRRGHAALNDLKDDLSFLFGLFALGDILRRTAQPDDLTVSIALHFAESGDPSSRAIRAGLFQIELVPFAGLHAVLDRGFQSCGTLRRIEL